MKIETRGTSVGLLAASRKPSAQIRVLPDCAEPRRVRQLCDPAFAEVTMSRIAIFIACAMLLVLALPDQASARRGGGFRGGFRGFRGGMGRGRGFRGGRRGIAWRG